MHLHTNPYRIFLPLLKTASLLSPVKHCASPLSSEFRALSLCGGENGVSTSSAMATEAQVSTQDDKLKDAQMEAADKPEKVVFPTNESSETLIRIRYTNEKVMMKKRILDRWSANLVLWHFEVVCFSIFSHCLHAKDIQNSLTHSEILMTASQWFTSLWHYLLLRTELMSNAFITVEV
nr:uncharacterized protein LOC103412658 isoform X2 [Malus domestica]